MLPAASSSSPDGDHPGEDREGYFGGRDGAEVETDRTLNPGDHRLRHAFGSQSVEVMAGVATAAYEPDEARFPGKERFQRRHQIFGVVIGVDGVDLGAER